MRAEMSRVKMDTVHSRERPRVAGREGLGLHANGSVLL